MKVYLDNGASTQVAKEAAKEMAVCLRKKFGNSSSIHYKGEEAKEVLENSRKKIAEKINAKPQEIIFTSGATESDNLAIKGLAKAYPEKKHIITSSIEHPAVLESCRALEKDGYKITYLKVDKEGIIDLKELEQAISKDTLLVSIMHVNNEIGAIEPITEIGEICKKNNVLFHTDAVQSFTKIPIDVNMQNISSLSLSAHKLHGPKGVGVLFVKEGVSIKPLFHGGAQEFSKRAGTENIPGIAGFAAASDIITEEDIKRMETLRDRLLNELAKLPDILVNGPVKNRVCNNVNISFRHIEGESLLLHLSMKGIAVSTGSACSSTKLRPSHVLLAIGRKPEDAHGSIRFTLSKYTTEKEIDYTIKHVKKIVKSLRKISPLGGRESGSPG